MKKICFLFLIFGFIIFSFKTYGSQVHDIFFDELEKTVGTKRIFPLEVLNDTLQASIIKGDSINVAKSCYIFGKYYLIRTYNYPLAYNYFFRALNIFKSKNDEKGVGITEMQIGLVYYLQQNYYEAIPYFEAGYSKMKLVNDSVRAARLAYLLGLSYSENSDYNKALSYLEIVRKYFVKNNSEQSKREYEYGMGKYYLNIKNGDSALYYFMPFYEKSIELNDTPNVQRYASEIAIAWHLKNNSQQTEYFARKAISEGRNINTGHAFMNCYHLLYGIALDKKNYIEAVDFLNKYVMLKDSIINEKNLFDLASLKTKLTLDKDKQERDLHEAEQQAAIEKQKVLKTIFILSGIFLLVIVLLLRNRNKALGNSYSKLKSTQDQLINQEKLVSMGKLSAGIAHEMLNPLNFVIGFTNGIRDNMDEIEKASSNQEKNILVKETKKIVSKISEHANRMELSVKQVINHVRINPGKKEPSDVHQLCDSYLSLVSNSMSMHQENFSHKITKNYASNMPKISVNPQEIGRVLMNILTNSFQAIEDKLLIEKFEPIINITTAFDGKNILIAITDNGIGINKENSETIFNHFFSGRGPGKGVGLGLSVANDIVKSYGGKISVISVPMVSTTFKIEVPV